MTTSMQEEFESKWRGIVENDFVPANRVMQVVKPEERIAFALEYIAAQMGEINATLGQLLAHQRMSGK
jgi:hypothetical protein